MGTGGKMKYTPDKWVIVKIMAKDRDTIYKVLAGWYGGYLEGESWKLNSGITMAEDFVSRVDFTGHSGSVYSCYKTNEGLSGYTAGVLEHFKKKLEKVGATIEVVDYADFYEQFPT